MRLQLDPSVVIVDEDGIIYLVPLGETPRRLNRAASLIVRSLKKHNDVAVLLLEYAGTLNIPRDQAEQEVHCFVQWMEEKGYVSNSASS